LSNIIEKEPNSKVDPTIQSIELALMIKMWKKINI